MDIQHKIQELIKRSTSNGQYSVEDISSILLNKSDWDEYVAHKNSIGETDYKIFEIPIKLTNSIGPSRCYFFHSRVSRKIGIIGTAGRGDDLPKLDKNMWKFMKASVGKLIETTGANCLVSGGAAWADHVAVNIFLNNIKHMSLSLHLPCQFTEDKFDEGYRTGKILNFHHKNFSEKLGVDTLSQLRDSINNRCSYTIANDSFYERNSRVAAESDILVAFTFGTGKDLKKGGTKDTFDKFLKKQNRGLAFHINLSDLKIYIY